MRETYLAAHPDDEDIAAMGSALDAVNDAIKRSVEADAPTPTKK